MKVGGPDGYFKKDRIGGPGKSDRPAKSDASSESGKGASASRSDAEKIAVSDLGKEISKVHEQLRTTPDVRVEKVQELKDKIEDGTYYVPSDKIAGKIIEGILKQG